ncbi:tRNA lysidine(34) synthetase TilS [bacterium G20]|nr:tRNA lysidine(34) synthetase TilS [bacterium G20]
MEVVISPGKYIVAVSGGVDSMVLLDLLVKQAESQKDSGFKLSAHSLQLVVAHFNHGIRSDSDLDERLVTKAAHRYGLPFEVGYGKLGPKTGEDQARRARYSYLEDVKRKHKADGIITAHHQDDLIETALINILRGTGRQGLSSIRSKKIIRPLLNVPKKEILNYAQSHSIEWREDKTNTDLSYLRNYIRHKIMPGLSTKKKADVIRNLDKVAKINEIIDQEIATLSHNNAELDRQSFIMLPNEVGNELLVYWLRQNNLRDFDRKTVARVSTIIKTASAGSKHDILKGQVLTLTKTSALLS